MNAIWIAVAAVSLLGLAFGAILGYASRRFAVEDDPVVEKIDEILPQSQCGQCGYPACRPYAEAISCNGEKINRCAPGGEAVMLKIAELLNVEPQPLDGEAQELTPARMVAVIDENNCIGCTKCIQACPVDDIIGTNKTMHTIIPDLCTGCELCVAPCPTDCISRIKVKKDIDNWNWKFDPKLVIPVVNTTEIEKKLVVGESE